jgi:hypothetical protein
MTATASSDTPGTMPHRAWLMAAFAMLLLGAGINFAIAWKVDLFGILRDPRGRVLRTSRHERQAKYLLNFRYVPENFDALVIGASSSANWRLEGLSRYRFYNESMLGADGPEERVLVEKAMEHGHFKVALVGISRGVTDRSDLQDGLAEADPHEALGSFYSYVMMLDRLHDRLSHRQSNFYPDGSWEFPQHKMGPPDLNKPYPVTAIDPKAAADYRALIEELQASGTRIIYVVAPHYGLEIGGARQILADYVKNITAQLPPAPLIDFNDDRYASLRNTDNMIDEDHLSDAGSVVFSRLVIERMNEILHEQ